ncbi:MAG: hydantoinase/oxoprolinase family protein, partial [Candidatus Latescibacterota bacterium]|nr:hydantoinase/oxoprolinase family protein [Candidatus Latescibacterota bacterium]
LLVMQSNGGMLDADAIADMPVQTVMSGPAAGVMGAARLAGYHGVDRLITYDLGGTSLDVSLVVDGEPATSSVTEIEFGIPVGTSMIDVRAIGAGGGSIARVDEGGILQIGPESAGADPGPVCYASGGADPTLTDALVVLGLINPDRSITGSKLDVTGAGKVIFKRVAEPLDLSLEQAAEAIVTVATNRISGSLRRISIDRGHDPRDFSLFAFGGGGPLFASPLLRELGTRDALIPTFPGIASAWGCAVADVRRDFVRMLNKRLTDIDFDDVAATIDEHSSRGKQFIDSSGIPVDRIDIVIEADTGFEGQTHVIRTPLSADALDDDDVRRRFRAAYERHYGVEQIEFEGLADLMDELPIRILNVRTSVLGVRSALSLKELIDPPVSSLSDASLGDRSVYFEGRMRPCPTYDRLRLPWDARIEGPAVVEQEDSTFWIEPGVSGHVLEGGSIRLQVAT